MSSHAPIPSAHREVIDLTAVEPDASLNEDTNASVTRPLRMRDLDRSGSMHADEADHMHAVVDLLRPGSINCSDRRLNGESKSAVERRPSQVTADSCEIQEARSFPSLHKHQSQNQDIRNSNSKTCSLGQNRPYFLAPELGLGSIGNHAGLPLGQTSMKRPRDEKPRAKLLRSVPFMEFPPEIRNTVYKFLLTTNSPIEFEGLTGRNGSKHRAQWLKCTTAKSKRKHKKLFLEILEVCRQIHDEASGIIYGCNVFKYRNNGSGEPKNLILPTRHRQLLKHIKVSIISSRSIHGQDTRVANFINYFSRGGLMLESFELTWYGESRLCLARGGPVCRALQLLRVERQFVVAITGEARMEKEMQVELEKTLTSRRVEIRRPVKAVTGEELSEDEAT